MQRSEQINELATALSKAQGEIKGAIRGDINPAFRSKYADLQSVWEAIRGPFTKHGLSVVQGLSSAEGGVECNTMLLHSSGQWISESLFIPADKHNAHGFGSAATYARRFSLQGIAGVAPVDDDGNAAAEATPPVPANPWTNEKLASGTEAAKEGEYAQWWKKQDQAFRTAALRTPEHTAFKASQK